MTLSLSIEILLSALLVATLVYCAILERRLAMLRKGQDGLKQTIGELNGAIVSAATSMRSLKESASEAAEILDGRLSKARGMADELSVLTASGERIAERFAAQRGAAVRSDGAARAPAAGVLANRLQALKPDALRNVR